MLQGRNSRAFERIALFDSRQNVVFFVVVLVLLVGLVVVESHVAHKADGIAGRTEGNAVAFGVDGDGIENGGGHLAG